MEICTPTEADWELFLCLARLEGWGVPGREIELFRGVLSQCAFVLREEGIPLGFVTAIHHQKSAWIGNLIVDPQRRGRGLGVLLFEHAFEVLRLRGARSIWLTASAQGRPIYEKRGFRRVDGIERWSLLAGGIGDGEGKGACAESELLDADFLVWGESRSTLLSPLSTGGRVFTVGGTAALLQSPAPMQILGPWISRDLCPRENRLLLADVLSAAVPGREIVADVAASSPLRPLLVAAAFERVQRCDLMVCGNVQGVDLCPLVSLASLGSMG